MVSVTALLQTPSFFCLSLYINEVESHSSGCFNLGKFFPEVETSIVLISLKTHVD